MPLIYRAMLIDGDKPRVGPTKKTLGVKPGDDIHDDIPVDENGDVRPGTGGMSVAPAWRDLPAYRIPRRLQPKCRKATGNNNYACWRMGEGPFSDGNLAEGLNLVIDSAWHGIVKPADVMSLERFQALLAATQDLWVIDEE